MIDKLEEDIEQMESLSTLKADNTAITRVPNSLVRLKNIAYISLCGLEGLSRDVFPSIIWSWTSPRNKLSSLMQTSVGMSCPVSLEVPHSSFHGLSSAFSKLPEVQSLPVECGSRLQITGDTDLDTLNATSCTELETMLTTSQVSTMKTSALTDCHISRSKNFLSFYLIQMGINCPITKILEQSISQKLATSGLGDCLLPGNKNPDWLTFNDEGYFVNFEVPQVNGHNLKTMTLCIVYSSTPDIITSNGFKKLFIINSTKATTQSYDRDALTSFEDEKWQNVISSLEPGNKVEIVVVFGYGFIVNKTAIYLIYDEPIEEKMEHCHAGDMHVIVSGGDDLAIDKNVSISSDDHMAGDKNTIVFGGDDIVADKNENVVGVDDEAIEKNFAESGGDDVPVDKKCHCL